MSSNLDLQQWDSDLLTIWVLHADKIPPHLGISDKNGFYSLKVKGKDEAIPSSKMLELVQRKKIPTILFVLDAKGTLPLKLVFDTFDRASSKGATCLAPISEVIGIVGAETIHDVITILNTQNKIQQRIGMNLPFGFENIPAYVTDDIVNRLKLLE